MLPFGNLFLTDYSGLGKSFYRANIPAAEFLDRVYSLLHLSSEILNTCLSVFDCGEGWTSRPPFRDMDMDPDVTVQQNLSSVKR